MDSSGRLYTAAMVAGLQVLTEQTSKARRALIEVDTSRLTPSRREADEGRTQRALSMWQRKEVQEMPSGV
jgi:hypothetical protein